MMALFACGPASRRAVVCWPCCASHRSRCLARPAGVWAVKFRLTSCMAAVAAAAQALLTVRTWIRCCKGRQPRTWDSASDGRVSMLAAVDLLLLIAVG